MKYCETHQWAKYAYAALAGEQVQQPGVERPVRELENLGISAGVDWAVAREKSGTGPLAAREFQSVAVGLLHEARIVKLGELLSVLKAHDIPGRAIKGMAATLHLYHQREEVRPMADVDVLVRPEDFLQAVSVLRGVGYELVSREEDVRNPHINQVCMSVSLGAIVIEIDLHRLPHNYPLHCNIACLAFDASFTDVIGEIEIPNTMVCFLWILCHRLKDCYRGDLRELVDGRLYLQQLSEDEFKQLIKLIDQHGLALSAYAFSVQAQYWFGCDCARSTSLQHSALLGCPRGYASLMKRFLPRYLNRGPTGALPATSLRVLSYYLGAFLSPGLTKQALHSFLLYNSHKIRLLLKSAR